MTKKHFIIALSLVVYSLQGMGVVKKTSVKENSEVNPILPYNLCADPTAVEYNGRLYVYGTNDQQELNSTGNTSSNTYGKITQLVCMSTADMVNWTFHGIIDVKKLSPWIATSWAPSIVSREEEDGKTHFYLYYTNSASGIGVLTATSPTGPWKDPIGKALINGSTPGRGDQSNIIDPGVCIDSNGVGWLTFGGGDPNKSGSKLMPGNARIVRLGKDMTSLDGKIYQIPAPFHFEANELNYINGKYVFSYSGGWSCNATDWDSYTGKGSYSCPGNCSILAMTTDDPVNGTWKYNGEILKNPGSYGYPWGNNHSHLQKFGNSYYMIYHTQYLEGKLGLSGGYRGIAINKATVSGSSCAVTTSMTNAGPSIIEANRLLASDLIEAETMANSAGVKVTQRNNRYRDCVVTDVEDGSWTMVRGLKFDEKAQSWTVRIKGKGTLSAYANLSRGDAIAVADFDNKEMTEVTFDLPKAVEAGKTYSYFFLLFSNVDASSAIEFDNFTFNSKSVGELTPIVNINATDDNAVSTGTYNLSGQRVGGSSRGIVIRNGRKYVK